MSDSSSHSNRSVNSGISNSHQRASHRDTISSDIEEEPELANNTEKSMVNSVYEFTHHKNVIKSRHSDPIKYFSADLL